MSIFSGVKGFFTGRASIDKVTDALIKTGDAVFYTSEEKSEDARKRFEAWLELQRVLGSESTPRSVNRRIVAWAVIFMMFLITMIAVVLRVFGHKDASTDIALIAVDLHWQWAFVSVIVFYFGPHLIAKITGKK